MAIVAPQTRAPLDINAGRIVEFRKIPCAGGGAAGLLPARNQGKIHELSRKISFMEQERWVVIFYCGCWACRFPFWFWSGRLADSTRVRSANRTSRRQRR